MNTEFTSIDPATLDTVTGGGGRGEIVKKGVEWGKKGANWAWNNVVKPAAGWAGFDWAQDKITGGGKQPPAQPQP